MFDSLSRLTSLGLGTSHLASLGSSISKQQTDHLIRTALDRGILVIDTADTYGSGDAERRIGHALRGRRDEVFLITKAGLPFVALPSFLSPLNQIGKKLLQMSSREKNFSKCYLMSSVQGSLKRLKVDCLDAFLLHEPEANEATSESWEALFEIRSAGFARTVGVSTANLEVLARAFSCKVLDLVQTPVIIGDPQARKVLDFCAAHQIPVIANQVLRALSKLATRRADLRHVFTEQGLTDADPIALLLGWAAAQPAVRTILIGTRNLDHLLADQQALLQVEQFKSILSGMQEVARCS
jgi:aryl-alcohol dehydrogenase-like predicted oxidoreductase